LEKPWFLLFFLVLLGSFFSQKFLTLSNMFNVLRQMSEVGIIAFAITPIIIAGKIDLSVGALMAVASVLSSTMLKVGYPVFYVIFASLGITALIGFLNGILIAKAGLESFLVTLSMMGISRGLAQIFVEGRLVEFGDSAFLGIGRSYIGFVPVPVFILAITFFLFWILLNFTVLGVRVFAIGGNPTASYYSGLSISKNLVFWYLMSGFFAGLSGLIYTARIGAGEGMAGYNYELDAIAAVVVGGTPLSGGRGGLIGTLVGVVIIGIVTNLSNMLGVTFSTQIVIKALIILLFASFSNIRGE
jgi:ribose/xylose/arabinose/galactoside ABC-type transport system permease subunit